MLKFPSQANGAGCGSTGEFFSFFAVTALKGGVGVKGGGSGVVEEKSSGWALHAKGSSVVDLMLCFTRGANAAVGGAMGGLGAFDAEEALVKVIVLGEGGGVVQQVASSGAVDAGRGGAWLIGVRSDGASGAGGFSGVGVGTDGAVGTFCGEGETGLSGIGAGGATFALGVGGESEFVGVGAGGAGFASCLRGLVGEASGGAIFTGVVVFESAGGAATGGGGGVAVHAGGGRCVADTEATGAGGRVGGCAVGVVAGGDPSGIGRGLAFVFGTVAIMKTLFIL